MLTHRVRQKEPEIGSSHSAAPTKRTMIFDFPAAIAKAGHILHCKLPGHGTCVDSNTSVLHIVMFVLCRDGLLGLFLFRLLLDYQLDY
jgi:hypothetical protein